MSKSVIFMPGIALFHRNPLYLNPWLWSIYGILHVEFVYIYCCYIFGFLLFLHYTCMSMFNICIYIPKFNYNLTVNVVVNFFCILSTRSQCLKLLKVSLNVL